MAKSTKTAGNGGNSDPGLFLKTPNIFELHLYERK